MTIRIDIASYGRFRRTDPQTLIDIIHKLATVNVFINDVFMIECDDDLSHGKVWFYVKNKRGRRYMEPSTGEAARRRREW